MTFEPADFLPEHTPQPLTLAKAEGLRPRSLYLGRGNPALEIAVAEGPIRPSAVTLKMVRKARLGGQAVPPLVVVWFSAQADPDRSSSNAMISH